MGISFYMLKNVIDKIENFKADTFKNFDIQVLTNYSYDEIDEVLLILEHFKEIEYLENDNFKVKKFTNLSKTIDSYTNNIIDVKGKFVDIDHFWGVLDEEIKEVNDEIKTLNMAVDSLEAMKRVNDVDSVKSWGNTVIKKAKFTINELVQVCAVIEKYKKSMEEWKEYGR